MRIAQTSALLALSLLAAPAASDACITVHAPGGRVKLRSEKALIVWDAERGVEHFIRTANFAAHDEFGFLVPTPTRPELGEVAPGLFEALEAAIESRRGTVVHHHTEGVSLLADWIAGHNEPVKAVERGGVSVIEVRRVSGLDATVLAADDAAELATWLGAHGFDGGARLEAWLRPYVAAGWMITAFRYPLEPQAGPMGAPESERRRRKEQRALAELGLETRPVRLSFASDRPYYPYREPADAEAVPGRILHVYVVSSGRMAGKLGSGEPWHATPSSAGSLATATETVAAAVQGRLPSDPWLTAFDDPVMLRPHDDLYFEIAGDQAAIDRPPHHEVTVTRVPVDAILVGVGLVGGLIGFTVRRRRARAR